MAETRMVERVRARLSSRAVAGEPARQAGGHWFEPSTAHFAKALLGGAFSVAGNIARLSQQPRQNGH
jgi:hypothetical protein